MAIGYALAGIATVVVLYLWLRTGDNSNRIQALKRLTLGIPFFFLMFVIGAVFAAYVIFIATLDIIYQFLTGRDGFSSDGYADRLWDWKDTNTRYLMVGEGRFRLFP